MRCFRLILNCLQAWIDLYQTIDRYYTSFTVVMTTQVNFPDFGEYNIDLAKTGGIPPAIISSPLVELRKPRETKIYPHISSNLEQTRMLLKDIIGFNDKLEDCTPS